MPAQRLATKGPINRSSTSGAAAAPTHPWQLRLTGENLVRIDYAPLVTAVVTGTEATVTGLSGHTLNAVTKIWLSTSFSAGMPASYSVNATGPGGDLFTYDSSNTQTGAWLLIGEVIEDAHPNKPGFDFTFEEDRYHLLQRVNTELEEVLTCVNGKPTWRVLPR